MLSACYTKKDSKIDFIWKPYIVVGAFKNMNPYENFALIDPGMLQDGDLELRLIRTILHSPESNLAPEYNFGMDLIDVAKDIGRINIRISNNKSLIMYRGPNRLFSKLTI